MAKFDVERAQEALNWMEQVLGRELDPPSHQVANQKDVRAGLKDGVALCE